MKKEDLKIVVLENMKAFGKSVNMHLNRETPMKKNYILNVKASRFSNGEGKVTLERSVRDKDLYILTDVGNYGITYNMHGVNVPMSPDEHFQDIKRVISASNGHAKRVSLIMPLLYQSRQHKRKGRESLDCAIALQELEKLGVDNIITFDAHDPSVSNAIPLLPFENFYPTHTILNSFINENPEIFDNLLVVSPDMGATERARYYAEMLGCNVGVFYKRRDLTKVVNGKNPIIEHVYMGDDVKGKNVLVTDDMIASGDSMLEVAKELRKRGAAKIYLIATFALLTEGYQNFQKAYQNKYFDKLYSTNLSYVPNEIKKEEWYCEVDCTEYVAEIIETMNSGKSVEPLKNGKEKILKKVRRVSV